MKFSTFDVSVFLFFSFVIEGMRKEWILTEEEKRLKRKKIERNRLLKQQQAHLAIHHSSQNNVDLMHSKYASNPPLMTSNEVRHLTVCVLKNNEKYSWQFILL